MSKIKNNLNFSVLNQAGIEKVHEKALYIMSKIGMRMTGERSIKLLLDAGATRDADDIVHIPEKLVARALASAPKALKLYNREGRQVIEIDSRGQKYFGTHADQLEFVDPFEGRVRPFLKKDTKTMCKIGNYLKNIDFILSVGMSADVDSRIQTQTTFIETLRHFNKVVNFSTNDVESLNDCIGIAADFAGGLKNFQDKPFAFNYCEPIPPLTHPIESTEKLYISAQNRVPVCYMPYVMMGGTAPMSKAGTLAQVASEALTGLVLTQLVSEGTPFIFGAMPTIMDMQSTIGSYAAPEFHLNIAAMADLVNYYGLPFYGTAGCSDAKFVDQQAASECAFEIMSTSLSKANFVHDVGVLDHCKSISPEMVVLADEMIDFCGSYVAGIPLEDEDFVLDVMEEVGPAGEFITHEHTLEHFRDAWYPSLYSRKMTNPDVSEIMPKIRGRINYIVNEWDGPALDASSDKILASWERKLGII